MKGSAFSFQFPWSYRKVCIDLSRTDHQQTIGVFFSFTEKFYRLQRLYRRIKDPLMRMNNDQKVKSVFERELLLRDDFAGELRSEKERLLIKKTIGVHLRYTDRKGSLKRAFADMRHAGLTPRLLNIGGGYPVRHVKPIPSIEVIGEVINAAIADLPADIHVMAEPGRYLVSDAAYFVCRVVGTATRNGKRWMYWDAGMFGGVIEVTEGLRYEIITDRTGHRIPWCVAGPTCDSVDILMRDEMLSEDVQEGDFIYIPNAGAYTTAYASNFNGFPLPDVVVI